MKTEQGLVIEVNDNVAKIKAGRHSDCKNCGACPGDNNIIITATNNIGAKPGQRVLFEIKEDKVLKATFIVFILPLVFAFIGVLIGGGVGQHFNSDSYIFEIAGGVITFLLSLAFVKFYDKAVNANNKSQPSIISIL